MKHSLRLKVALILILSFSVLIFLCWIINQTFLEGYYKNDKVNSLSESYYSVNSIAGKNEGISSNEAISRIERIEENSNVSIYIITEEEYFGHKQITFCYPVEIAFGEPANSGIERYQRIIFALKHYIFVGESGTGDESIELLTTKDERFDVYKFYDNRVDSNYIDLVGFLDNGLMVFIRSNYENIQESTRISSKFLGIVGICIMIVGAVYMYLFSRSFTKPITDLTEIAKQMSALNFEKHYTEKRKDELGALGSSINTLSDKLEDTITELKTANIELQRDIERKTEIDEMRKEFLSNVSHELKTPIALIQGYAEGLSENINEDEESRRFYCEVIVDEARKMNDMVKKLLNLNQIEFGTNKLELERFDIVELVRSVSESVDILIKQKNITLVFNSREPIFVWADQYSVEEVVTNFMSNALNHVSGKNIIDIKFVCSDNKVRVSVFNTGNNIPEDEIGKIWIKFYKVDKARTREYGGSGIGLSIVKAIMEAHNQKCGVINHPSGVEFWFELDIKSDEKGDY